MGQARMRLLRLWPLVMTVTLGGCVEFKTSMQIPTKQKLNVVEQYESIPFPKGPDINSDNIIFYHQAFSAKPYGVEDLLQEGTVARKQKDEFARQAVIRREVPGFVKRIEQAKVRPAVYTALSKRLGEYDFKTQSFSTDIGKDWRFVFSTPGYYAADNYGITIVNPEQHQRLNVPEAEAQVVARGADRNQERKVVAIVSGTVVGTTPGSDPADAETQRCLQAYRERAELAKVPSSRLLSMSSGISTTKGCNLQPRLVKLRVEKIEFYLPSGKFIGRTDAAR